MPSAIGSEDNEDQRNAVPQEILSSSLGHVFRSGGYRTVYAGKRHLTGARPATAFENPSVYGFNEQLVPEDPEGRETTVDAMCRLLGDQETVDQPLLLYVSLINPRAICYLPLRDEARR